MSNNKNTSCNIVTDSLKNMSATREFEQQTVNPLHEKRLMQGKCPVHGKVMEFACTLLLDENSVVLKCPKCGLTGLRNDDGSVTIQPIVIFPVRMD